MTAQTDTEHDRVYAIGDHIGPPPMRVEDGCESRQEVRNAPGVHWWCVRPRVHGGNHAVGDLQGIVVAVWPIDGAS